MKNYFVSHENVGCVKKYFPLIKISLYDFISSSFTLGCTGFTLGHLYS